MPQCILYRKLRGFKYLNTMTVACPTGIRPEKLVTIHAGPETLVSLATDGTLTVRDGYAWDGPSGPTFDTLTFMRGSMFHDALYQLMRAGLIPPKSRLAADKLLRQHCLEDGMWKVRAWWVYHGVRIGASFAAKVQDDRSHEIFKAP